MLLTRRENQNTKTTTKTRESQPSMMYKTVPTALEEASFIALRVLPSLAKISLKEIINQLVFAAKIKPSALNTFQTQTGFALNPSKTNFTST